MGGGAENEGEELEELLEGLEVLVGRDELETDGLEGFGVLVTDGFEVTLRVAVFFWPKAVRVRAKKNNSNGVFIRSDINE